MAKISATARFGDEIIIDTSEEACAKFDVKPGEEISPLGCGRNAFVVGTGLSVRGGCTPDGTEVLWLSTEKECTEGLFFFASKKKFRKI
jgi:hypothetical protein